MKIWVLTDTHFGHDRMQHWEKGARPEGFERRYLDNVAQTVCPEDILVHLGDVAFYDVTRWHDEFMSVCPCRRWLVRGNHDRESLSWYLSHGWHFVADEIKLDAFGRQILLSHRPANPARTDFDVNVHGHYHTLHEPLDHRYVPVRSELDYKLIKLRTLVE